MKKKIFWNKFWIVLTLLLTVIYLGWRIFRTVPYEKSLISYVFWVLLLAAEMFGLFEMAVHFYNMYDYGNNKVEKPKLDERIFPEVDVFVPSFNESAALIRQTLEACKKMKYPDPEKVHIYLCDDGEREEMQKLAGQLGVEYLARTVHNSAKAGNLNYALKHSGSPLIAVFDADMMPAEGFLMETVPYFAKNVEILRKYKKQKKAQTVNDYERQHMTGFVQTPQNFYQPDLFQKNLYAEDHIPNEQDYFYHVVQMSKNKSNSVIFGGTNAMLWRAALLEVGGFVEDVVTEDFATGIELEKKGYRGIAIDTILASGLPAMTFSDMIHQRKRWAKGCIQSGHKTGFLKSKELNFYQKINYFTSISYWYNSCKRLAYFAAPVAFALFGIVSVECRLSEVLLFWLPMYLCTVICMRRFSGHVRVTKWTDIYENTFFPYLLPSVLKESIGKKQKQFVVTGKESDKKKNSSFKYMLPYLAGVILSVVSIIRVLALSASEQTVTYVVIIFWLFINLYYMVMSLYVSWGRSMTEDLFAQKELPHKLGKVRVDEVFTALLRHLTEF